MRGQIIISSCAAPQWRGVIERCAVADTVSAAGREQHRRRQVCEFAVHPEIKRSGVRITESEFVAEFLRAEFQSPRHRVPMRIVLEHLKLDEQLLLTPDPRDPAQNRQRTQFLSLYKGYRRDEALFKGFPARVEWWEAALPKACLGIVETLNDPDIVRLLGGHRRLTDAARYLSGSAAADDPWLEIIFDKLKSKRAYRPILVGGSLERLVILDGHARLWSYALAGDDVPDELDILVGLSTQIGNWSYFGP